jgi:CRP/FNR family transcriptional regulator, nitrogen oxide reductase regulator
LADSAGKVGVAYMSNATMLGSESAAIAPHLKSRFLDGLAPGDLKVILAAARQRHFLPNSVVVNQGHPADHLFLLTRGRARFFFNTREGKKIILLWLTPGEVFGGMALLSIPSSYLVSTETLKDSSTLVWDRATLRNLAVRYPRLLENALLIASDYMAWYLADHAALISQTARQRLARTLVCLAETIGNKSSDGFEFDATNEELAGAANVTPFTASRLLSEWQKNHAVIKRRGKILLRSPERLFLRTA